MEEINKVEPKINDKEQTTFNYNDLIRNYAVDLSDKQTTWVDKVELGIKAAGTDVSALGSQLKGIVGGQIHNVIGNKLKGLSQSLSTPESIDESERNQRLMPKGGIVSLGNMLVKSFIDEEDVKKIATETGIDGKVSSFRSSLAEKLGKLGEEQKTIGETLINTANRDLTKLRNDFNEQYPITPKTAESLTFRITNQGVNFASMLALGMIPYVGEVAALSYGGLLTLGSESEEGMETYKRLHGGSLEGYGDNMSGEDLAFNVANAGVQTIIEKFIGIPAQLKAFKGTKEIFLSGALGAAEEIGTENLQNLIDASFDKISNRMREDETIWKTMKDNFSDTLIAGLFGGTTGSAFAAYNRSKGIDFIEKTFADILPEKADKKAFATNMYDTAYSNLTDFITKELDASSELKAYHGEIYEAAHNAISTLVDNARKQGAYKDIVDENELAEMVNAESRNFADRVIVEANLRNESVTNVLKASDINIEDGKLAINMAGVKDLQLERVESLQDELSESSVALTNLRADLADVQAQIKETSTTTTTDEKVALKNEKINVLQDKINKLLDSIENIKSGKKKAKRSKEERIAEKQGQIDKIREQITNLEENIDSLSERSGLEKKRATILENIDTLKRNITKIKKEYDALNPRKVSREGKGSITWRADKALIDLTSKANGATLPHELAHYWLQNTFLYSKTDNASDSYKSMMKDIANYLGIKPEQERISRVQHEKFARSYETYLKNRIAPKGLDKAFYQYDKWLKGAYRRLKDLRQNPVYRDEDGKIVKPNLTPEIVNVFNEMTTGIKVNRQDIRQAIPNATEQTVKDIEKIEADFEEYEEIKQKQTVFDSDVIRKQPVKAMAEKSISESVTENYSRVIERVLGEQVEYNKITIKDEWQKAQDYVNNTSDSKLKDIADGKTSLPDGIMDSAFMMAYSKKMYNQGNYTEAYNAIKRHSLKQTRRGQEIVMEKAMKDDFTSLDFWTDYLRDLRTDTVVDKLFKGTKEGERKSKLKKLLDSESKKIAQQIEGKSASERVQIIKENMERISRENGIDLNLLDEDIYNGSWNINFDESYASVRSLIEKSIGIELSEEELKEIGKSVKELESITKESAERYGNPSIRTLEKIRELKNLIESYEPSHPVAIWMSSLGRATMLASVKSPVLNIMSNIESYATETIARKISQKGLSSIVDKEIVKNVIDYYNDAYSKSRFMLSVTDNITSDYHALGEKRITTQGEGAFRAVAQFAEDKVFGTLMGAPDNYFKTKMFTDVTAEQATKQAYKENLNGQQAVDRANELFKDAARIEPETEIGKEIRKKAMVEAHIATFTNESGVTKMVMGIRDAINKATGKARLGDILMPFVATPANVTMLSLEYGVGALYTAYNIPNILKDPTSEVSQRAIRALVRNGIGVILIAALSSVLEPEDYIPSFENANPKQRALVKLKQAQFNAVKINGKWINIDYFGTLAAPLEGWLTARSRENDADKVTGYLLAEGATLSKLPAIKELVGLGGALQESSKKSKEEVAQSLGGWVADQVYARSIPSIVSDVAKMIDNYERETDNSILKKILSRLPIARETLKARTDITGEKVRTQHPASIIGLGSRFSAENKDRLVREIDNLNKEGEMPTISDPTRTVSFSGLSKEMKSEVRTKFNSEYGKEAKKLIDSSSYKRMSSKDKKNALNRVRRKIINNLKKEFKKGY